MTKTQVESQLDSQSEFSCASRLLKFEQQTFIELFRCRTVPKDLAFVERIFVEFSDALLSSMSAAK